MQGSSIQILNPLEAALALGALTACGLVERKRTARKAQVEGPAVFLRFAD